jgi:predicted PurR-regulated permease PerM
MTAPETSLRIKLMNQSWPFYARFGLILLITWLLFYGIYIGQDILLPFGFAFLIAVLLRPILISLLPQSFIDVYYPGI